MLETFLRAFGMRPPRDAAEADLMRRLKDKPIETITAELSRRAQELSDTSVRLGVIGMGGAGKSSLINAIFGRPVARVGAVTVEHPVEGEEYHVEGFRLVDLPGAGAVTRPAATYVRDLRLLEPGRYDGFLLVTANRLTEHDVALYQELHVRAGKPFFVVRTHFDLAVQGVGDEAEARRQIDEFFRKHLNLPEGERVYLVASPQPERYDLPRLLEDMVATLPELKQIRALEVIPAYTEELLKKKRAAVEQVVFTQATLAAANGVNPIPGLDVAIDLKIIQSMTERVIVAFGLTRPQLEGLARTASVHVPVDRLLDVAAPVLSRLARTGLLALFKEAGEEALKEGAVRTAAKQGPNYFFKYGAKFAPLIGTLVSAGVNFTSAYLYGKYLLNECEETTRKLLHVLPPPEAVLLPAPRDGEGA